MAAEEEKKPDPKELSSTHVHIKVVGQDDSEVFFRVNRRAQLKKLMETYCERRSLDFKACVFLLDGKRLRGEHTPQQVGMEDGDEIAAMFHQDGGAGAGAGAGAGGATWQGWPLEVNSFFEGRPLEVIN